MLSPLRRQIAQQLPRNIRYFSEATEASTATSTSTSAAVASSIQSSESSAKAAAAKLPYFVPRNTRGNLPVYTDIRNAGSRYLVLIRNIEGNANALAKDLGKALFKPDTYEASRLKIQLNHSKHITLSGGRWKDEVVQFLKNKGF